VALSFGGINRTTGAGKLLLFLTLSAGVFRGRACLRQFYGINRHDRTPTPSGFHAQAVLGHFFGEASEDPTLRYIIVSFHTFSENKVHLNPPKYKWRDSASL
jgi:hypothetical protein